MSNYGKACPADIRGRQSPEREWRYEMIKRLICKVLGHKWQKVPLGYLVDIFPAVPRVACERCGFIKSISWRLGYGVLNSHHMIRGEDSDQSRKP